MTDKKTEALKLALESAAGLALEVLKKHRQMKGEYPMGMLGVRAVEKIEAVFSEMDEALAEQTAQQWNAGVPSLYPEPEPGVSIKVEYEQPEFFTHNVEQPYDWSEWVCPDPKSYLMKCCDCGLVHEAQFGVVRYKSETEREDCDMVDDPNLQAVFRMRRSEQWSPVDTAHRAGGLPMEQPAQQEPVACAVCNEVHTILDTDESKIIRNAADGYPEGRTPRVLTLQERVIALCVYAADWKRWCIEKENTTPPAAQPARKPLTDEQILSLVPGLQDCLCDPWDYNNSGDYYASIPKDMIRLARAIEAAHGIKGDA